MREADNSARWRRFHVDDDDDAEDDEEEEVETVEDSAPEDEGDPPPGPLGELHFRSVVCSDKIR